MGGSTESPPIGPTLGMGSGARPTPSSLEQPPPVYPGPFSGMSVGGGSALGLLAPRPAAGAMFGQQQQWGLFGPTDSGAADPAGGLGLAGGPRGQDDGLFGITDVMANARIGLYESHDRMEQQADPFGFGGTAYDGFNYQGGLGGPEFMPPVGGDDSGAPGGGVEDCGIPDGAPRYQQF